MTLLLVLGCIQALRPARFNDAPTTGGIFNAADFGAVDDDNTNNTAAFSACLDALVAAGGGRMRAQA